MTRPMDGTTITSAAPFDNFNALVQPCQLSVVMDAGFCASGVDVLLHPEKAAAPATMAERRSRMEFMFVLTIFSPFKHNLAGVYASHVLVKPMGIAIHAMHFA